MTDAEDQELLSQLEAAGAWELQEPPSDFVAKIGDRDASRGPDRVEAPRRSRRWPGLVVGALACAAAGVSAWALWPEATAQRGGLVADQRETVDVGTDAVVVAEAGAELDWTVADTGAVRVAHHAGAAFYRVDKGTSFEVVTPAGRVDVTGTCFTVDVRKAEMNRQMGKGIVFGASLAAAAVVTVYEGNVVLANDNGTVEVQAGGSAVARDGRAPSIEDDGGLEDDADQSRRARADRREAEHLRRQVAQARAEAAAAVPGTATPSADGEDENVGAAMVHPSLIPGFDYFDPSPEALEEMARCGVVAWDQPPIWDEGAGIGDELAMAAGLSQEESEAVGTTLDAFRGSAVDELQGLYEKLGGDADGVDAFSAKELLQLVYGRLDPEELVGAREAIAREKAGLEEPPSELSDAGRFMRWEAGLGDAFEAAVGEALGPERARDVRAAEGGWGSKRMTYTNKCMDQ